MANKVTPKKAKVAIPEQPVFKMDVARPDLEYHNYSPEEEGEYGLRWAYGESPEAINFRKDYALVKNENGPGYMYIDRNTLNGRPDMFNDEDNTDYFRKPKDADFYEYQQARRKKEAEQAQQPSTPVKPSGPTQVFSGSGSSGKKSSDNMFGL